MFDLIVYVVGVVSGVIITHFGYQQVLTDVKADLVVAQAKVLELGSLVKTKL